MLNFLKKNLFLIICILIILAVFVYIELYISNDSSFQYPNTQIKYLPTNTTQNNPTTTKIYKNTEFGFQFEYPKDLIVRENTFKSYYSKFNLEIVVKIEEQFDLVFDVNIVLPEFPDRSFGGIEKITSEVTVDGVRGVKYEYEFEGFPETAVIFPLGDLKIILGTGGGSKQYLEEFNQILSSFKFLK